jgi:hypothetical protein
MGGFRQYGVLFQTLEQGLHSVRPDVKRIRDNKINLVAAGGGNMTLQEEGPSEQDQHDSS